MKVIGVRFRSTKKIYYFNPNGFAVEKGDNVIVETSRGVEFGEAVIGIKEVTENEIVQPLQNVIRIASEEDKKKVENNLVRQKDAYNKCLEKIEEHGLDMKLVDAEYTFDNSKLIFYFTSDGRVDFRDLVRDLAVLFRTRIELRQIAVRDETKMLGGLGACGNEICCKRFLDDFATVSIKMAKEQNLSLNPTKISGLCGRLICCLNFEKDFYSEMSKKLPSVSETVLSPKGQAEVVATYPLKESVRVKFTNPDGSTDTETFHLNEITRLSGEQKRRNDEAEEGIDENSDFIPEDAVLTENAQSEKRNDNFRRHKKEHREENPETNAPEKNQHKHQRHNRNEAPAENAANENAPHERREKRFNKQKNASNGQNGAQTEKNNAPEENQNGEKRRNEHRRNRHQNRNFHNNGSSPAPQNGQEQ